MRLLNQLLIRLQVRIFSVFFFRIFSLPYYLPKSNVYSPGLYFLLLFRSVPVQLYYRSVEFRSRQTKKDLV